MTQIHLLNPFDNPFGGSEQRALELHALLLPHAEVTLWATEPPHDFFRRRWPIRTIDAGSGSLPQGGTVVIVGPYFPAERVFHLLRPRRLIYVYSTEAAWAALARLSDDAALRARVGAAARRRAEAVYSEAYAGEMVAYYLR